jgi:hypothetical protein
MDFWNVGVMEYGLFQKNRSLFNVLPDKFYNYIIIYFLIKKYIVKIDGRFANPLILP